MRIGSLFGCAVLGAFIGSSRFTSDVPDLIALHVLGRHRPGARVTLTFGLDQVNEDFEVLTGGEALRVVLVMPSSLVARQFRVRCRRT
jgi:Zn-dependent alcohol dehydrogenase